MSKKGGSTTQKTEVKLPPEIEAAAKANLDIGNSVASLGAVRYNAPTIAGFSPQQMAGMQATDQAAAAFGMPSAVNWQQQGGAMAAPKGMDNNALYTALTGMPPPNSQAGGFSGYSTQGIADDAYARLPAAQRALIESFTMNPVTGAAPTNTTVPAQKFNVQQALSGKPQSRNSAVTAAADAAKREKLRATMRRLSGGRAGAGGSDR